MDKVFIFDFDGTFYSGDEMFSKLPTYIARHRRDFLPNLSDEEYKQVVKENPDWKKVINGCDIVDMMYDFKKKYPEFEISVKDFWDWQNEKPDPIVIDKTKVVDADFIEQICEDYPVYVVSNSSPTHIKFYMKKLDIEPEWFDDIVSNRFTQKDRTKKHYYERILEKENVEPHNVYVFGDSVKSDLVPAKELGMNVHHVKNAASIKRMVKRVLNKEKGKQ